MMKKKVFFTAVFVLVVSASFVGAKTLFPEISKLLQSVSFSQKNPLQEMAGRKIPIDPKRWYQLNNTEQGLLALFDGKTDGEVHTGYGKILHSFEAYYPFQDNEEITIDHLILFDGEGHNPQEPLTISVIDKNWVRITVATFTGDKYKSWVGPRSGLDDYKLATPIRNPRYLVIKTASFYPTEIEFYGSYRAGKTLAAPSPAQLARQKQVKFKHTTGVNAFEWDFEDANFPSVVDPTKWQAIRNFSGVRHYLDWERLEPQEGEFTFNPVHAGGWNMDAIYEKCRAEGVEVLACLKTVPPWMRESYPKDQQDNEVVPVRFGKDFSNPASYREQARVAFQFAARYGHNKNLDPRLVQVSKRSRWKGDPLNQIKIGLGLVRYLECDNERDKWWKGRKAYQTGREYAANLSAFYDGHKKKLGPGIGVKNADPDLQVVMGGLAHPSTDYIRGMVDWCREFRGLRPDGTVNLCWDVINYHLYANDAKTSQGGKAYRGAAPEVSNAAEVAREFVSFAAQVAGGMPVWITETGYDLHPGSPFKAIPIAGKTVEQTQADWILRSSLLYARHGIDRVFFYQLVDDKANDPGQFRTSGLINQNRTRRPAADYLSQANKLLGDYAYQETLNQNPIVDRYARKGQLVYMLVVPDEKGRKADYTLDLGAPAAVIYTPQIGQAEMKKETRATKNGKLLLTVTETPVFVRAGPEQKK